MSALLREAILTTLGPRSRMTIALLAAACLGSLASACSAWESAHSRHELAQLESRGSRVLQFGPADSRSGAMISRASCEALAHSTGVRRAGVLIESGTHDVPELGAKTTLFLASVSLFPQLADADGVVGSALSGRPGSSRWITLGERAGADLRQVVTGPKQPEGIPTNTSVVLPVTADRTEAAACIAVLDRFVDVRTTASLLSAQLRSRGGAIAGFQVLVPTSDPLEVWLSRPGQLLPEALGGLGGLVTSLLTCTRSGEIAAYRLTGTSRRDLSLVLMFEAAVLGAVFCAAGAATAILVSSQLLSPVALLWSILAGAAAWMLACGGGVLRSVCARASSLARAR